MAEQGEAGRGGGWREADLTWATSARLAYLEDVDVSGGLVDIELGVGGVVRVDPLTREEVDDVLRPVLVSVSGCHLQRTKQSQLTGARENKENTPSFHPSYCPNEIKGDD